MNLLRLLFTVEVIFTAFAGVWALWDPAAFAAQFAEPPTGATLVFIRWLGAVYIVLAIVETLLLRQERAEPWVPVLAGMLVGDALHVVGAFDMLRMGGVWGVPAAFGIVLTIVLAFGRVVALEDPRRLLR
jgi:hypothetical protein